MRTLVALYYSKDKDDEEHWDVAQTANDYGIDITPTEKTDWGGETIFEVSGSIDDLNAFAIEFCSAEHGIVELFPTNVKKER